MMKIEFAQTALNSQQQAQLSAGFETHSQSHTAPKYNKQALHWIIKNEQGKLMAALTANCLWDWLYIDELWVDESCRGTGMGKKLMLQAEQYAKEQSLTGLWLWTQSWQAPKFYLALGFEEFTRFDNFPAGHQRIGFRKYSQTDKK